MTEPVAQAIPVTGGRGMRQGRPILRSMRGAVARPTQPDDITIEDTREHGGTEPRRYAAVFD